MKKILALLVCSAVLFGYDFGLKIGEFNSSETDSYFQFTYGKSRPYQCNLRSLFLPNNDKKTRFNALLGDAYKSFASLACNIDNENYFLWLIFKNDILEQIKYEKNEKFSELASKLAKKYPLIKSGKIAADDFYMADYLEFDIDENTVCKAQHCRDFSIFRYGKNQQILLIDAALNKLNKTCIVIRSDKIINEWRKNVK